MAGSYPDVPGRRMAWDVDGTIMLYVNSTGYAPGGGGGPISTWAEASAGIRQTANSENLSAALNTGTHGTLNPYLLWCLIFPEIRDLDGYFWDGTGGNSPAPWLYYSPDTTDGYDGTWNAWDATPSYGGHTLADYRDNIETAVQTGVRAVKAFQYCTGTNCSCQLYRFHIYDQIAAGETPDRLKFIDTATGLEFTEDVDRGDVPRGSSRDKTIRIRNDSATLTANGVILSAEDLYLGLSAAFLYEIASGGFTSTLNIGNLAAASNSGIITIRQAIPDTEDLAVHAPRHKAVVTSWT